ncbi:ribosome maturation factor RimP [Candidatus Nesciobacter abundans]|uniref:Ribosome maturation factor RimP n=1 Tax=Candidatus Nesciobacter abundans TaxID=2601668 RepID=A0A5C0UHD3_9PROT|nr:hypothetical protein [Candidatus Nesciobacter abundans]QEK39150.1 hypothetical protein FZC36_01735 [Candidatus Nesciobacter abundans]
MSNAEKIIVYLDENELKVYDSVFEFVKNRGYEITMIRIVHEYRSVITRVNIERIDKKPITHEDCSEVGILIDTKLKVDNIKANLEISSPGIDRDLTRLKDFEEHKGKEIKVKTRFPISESKTLIGELMSILPDGIELNKDSQNKRSEENSIYNKVFIPYNTIRKAKLISDAYQSKK